MHWVLTGVFLSLQRLGLGFAVSHISRKTREIWGTRRAVAYLANRQLGCFVWAGAVRLGNDASR